MTNFNLLIKHGKTNALVGKSGCGKSTICSLILRFYDVTSGAVLVDGKNVKSFNVQWLRSQMGLVCQQADLFQMSVRENVLYGDTGRENVSDSFVTGGDVTLYRVSTIKLHTLIVNKI